MRPFLLFIPLSVGSVAIAQPVDHAGHGGHGHGGANLLFLAQADGGQVAPAQSSRSSGSATGAFIYSKTERRFRFELTYAGLENGGPTSIALFNYGVGANGKRVALLCGEGAAPCPTAAAARIEGRLAELEAKPALLSEFASGRIYVQIDGGDGRPEIRGQLEANNAMISSRTYIAKLAPSTAPGTKGEGTAVLSETFLPGNRVSVDYSVTVAGTNGIPQDVALVGVPQNTHVGDIRFLSAGRLKRDAGVMTRAVRKSSFGGTYITPGASKKSLFATRFLTSGTAVPGLVIKTSKFPNGELTGEFVPVN